MSFHPSSTLRDIPKSPRTTPAQSHSSNVEGLPADWLVYEEMSRSGRYCHVKTTTLVNPITIAIMCGPARLPLEYLIEAEGKKLFIYICHWNVRLIFSFHFSEARE